MMIVVVEFSAIAISSYARSTHRQVQVGVDVSDVIARVWLNCRLVHGYPSSPEDPAVLDLGWLRPEDVVSIEVMSTQTSGDYRISRRLGDRGWQTLAQAGRRGDAADFQHLRPVLRTAFLAAGPILYVSRYPFKGDPVFGDPPSCGFEPSWAFAPAAGTKPGTTPGRPNAAFDIASSVATTLAWILAIIGGLGVLVAIFVGRHSSSRPWIVTIGIVIAELLLAMVMRRIGVDSALTLALCVMAGLVSVGVFLAWLLRDQPSDEG